MPMQASTVVNKAPTATGQKSLGVPSQVKGIKMQAVIIIQGIQAVQPANTSNAKLANNDFRHCAIKTMKTHPAPYKVQQMQKTHTTLKKKPQNLFKTKVFE